MDENPRIKGEQRRGRQKQSPHECPVFSHPTPQEQRQQNDQRTAQRRDSAKRQDIQILKRFFSSQAPAPRGDPGEGRPVKVRRVEGIPAPLQALGGDFCPDRLVSMQGGLGQIEKPQARSQEKNSSPNQSANRRSHWISLWCLAEMVKVTERQRPAAFFQRPSADSLAWSTVWKVREPRPPCNFRSRIPCPSVNQKDPSPVR